MIYANQKNNISLYLNLNELFLVLKDTPNRKRKEINISMPKLIQKYNTHMESVYLLDKQVSLPLQNTYKTLLEGRVPNDVRNYLKVCKQMDSMMGVLLLVAHPKVYII